ncbi:MAG: hypothetical protein QF860_11925 [Planctomycetota bacterium]|jgi:hypothetical protein|nr:hypothetical protein [Planctomycetota bacterium]
MPTRALENFPRTARLADRAVTVLCLPSILAIGFLERTVAGIRGSSGPRGRDSLRREMSERIRAACLDEAPIRRRGLVPPRAASLRDDGPRFVPIRPVGPPSLN